MGIAGSIPSKLYIRLYNPMFACEERMPRMKGMDLGESCISCQNICACFVQFRLLSCFVAKVRNHDESMSRYVPLCPLLTPNYKNFLQKVPI